jgi:exonuclease SbcC
VNLATQRQSASGKVTETLDIRISDEIGTRDYEMYSGGEAFRVDFALRIALARLLAERAGATMPTLIIDEGFGTQDAEGIDRLVQAITAIQDEFRLILVVTHIEDLKERFERRIEVSKDHSRGSLARVV